MRVHPQIPIGEIAAATPHTTKLFESLGIDYVMHGNLSLRDACAEAGVDVSTVKNAIEKMPAEAGEHNWADSSMQEMLDELGRRRHPALRTLLGETATAIAALARGLDGVDEVRNAFCALCDSLQPHMKREEHTVFPVIQHLEDCWTRNEKLSLNFFGGMVTPIASLIAEHHEIIDLAAKLDAAAEMLGRDEPRTTRSRDVVKRLVHEVREHIHLENNVLYPRAAALESAVLRDA